MKKSLKVLGICIIILLFSSFTLAAKTIPAFDPVLENAEGETTAFLVLNDEKKAAEVCVVIPKFAMDAKELLNRLNERISSS